jgi:uncharacterized repeat protein (TIGR01451 family)
VDGPGTQTNTATVTGADQFDPNSGNNSAGAAETPQQSDLRLRKSVSNPTPNVGDVVTYTITLSNAGPDGAAHVQVSDLLPAGLVLVAASPGQGTYDSSTGLWDVGNVPAGGVAALAIQARVNSPNPQFNTADVTHSDQFDPDAGNNSGGALETPQQADLAVGKSVSNPTPNVGDTITYTVTLTNSGPDAATGVTLRDVLPAGVSFVSTSATAGAFDPATRTWTVGTVSVGATQTLTITVQVVSPNPQANTAAVQHADQFDPNPANNTATSSETPQQADLVLAKTVSNATPNVGDTVTFTITLTNTGPAAATSVTVSDLLPAGLTFVSATPSQGGYNSATGVWTVGTVTTTTPQTLQIRATVASATPQTNTATVSHSDQFDPNPGNNTASSTETPQRADLALTKSVSDATPNVGDTITFTITLADLGPNDATNVRVSDLLPAGLTFVSATPSQGTYDGASGVWTVGTVSPGFARTLLLRARVVGPSPATNAAAVNHADQFDPDTTNNSATATETPQQSDLHVTKAVSNPRPNVGDVITFTVTLTNQGPDPATGVAVTDLLPPGLGLVSAAPSQGSYDSASGLWTVSQVDVSSPATLVLRARVLSPNPATNVATVSAADQFDPNPSDNTGTVTETPQQADLRVTKAVDNTRPNVGDVITFTVTLTNAGPDVATAVTLRDLLPAGLTFVSATPSEGNFDPGAGVWTVGAVMPAAPQTLLIRARVASPVAQTNVATIGQSDQFDPDTTNNTGTVTETPQQADLHVTKAVDNARPNVGDTITFTVTLTNQGPDPATAVTLTDLLPAGLTFVSATPSLGSYDSATGVWTVGTVNPGVPQTLLIRARVASPGPQFNAVTVTHADQFDPNPGDNSGGSTVTPQQSDLQVTKSVNNPTPNVGDSVTYTVTLRNAGPDAATNVTVQDTLPAGVSFVSAAPSQGTYNSTTGVWTVGTVSPGVPLTLILTATVTSPNPHANTAAVSHSDQFDPSPANNSDTTSTNPQQADLAVLKSVSDPRPNVGDTVTFTITLTNTGPSAAINVTVNDLLPAGLTFLSATPSQGSYNSATGVWTVGTVTTGTPQTLQIRVTVVSPNAQTNSAAVSHSDQFDPDAGNNSSSTTETPQRADLALSKTVSNPTPNVGDTVTFTIALSDRGPDAATGVTVSDLLPAGLTFVSATPTQGNYNSATGVWTVGTVTTATPQTLTIQATVVGPGTRTNKASVSHSDQFDPDPTNNTTSVTETPQQADLALAKTVSNPTPNVGDVITYIVTLTNAGPNAATGVSVNEPIPAGLTFVSATTGTGSYNSFTGVWTVGTLGSGASAALTVAARVISPAAQTNTVTIGHSDQFDPNPGNNTTGTTETPQRADLAVAKAVSNATPNVGDVITYTVTLTNTGPDPATNVRLTDVLPAGLTFLTATASQGSYSSATGIWVVGTVAPGVTQTLQVQARVSSPAAQTNTATISGADQFDPNPGNNTGSTTETPQQADLRLAKTVSNSTPNVGDVITYTLTLTNNGPGAATSVAVSEPIPAGLSFVSAAASAGSYDRASGLWSVGTVAVGTPQTLQIQVRVVSPVAQTNVATVSHSDQFDPNPGDNTATTTETPQRADLALTKTVSNPTPNVGDTITFTVTLTNRGPDAATNVTVADLLPAGLNFVSATPSQGTYDSATGVWAVGTVATLPLTLQIRAVVASPDPRSNMVTVRHSDQFDPNTRDNTAGTTETPQRADLAVGKTVSNPTPNVGDTISYTITVTDNGPDAATGVTVQDALPVGVVFVAAAPSQGSYNPSTGVWTVGTVNVGGPATLTIFARVTSPNPQANTASVSHSDQFDPNPGNNTDTASTNPQAADLQLGKTVSNPRPNVGDTVTFTITLTNTGPSAATNVRVSDLLPGGLTFVSATPSQGTYDATAGVWTVGAVASGAQSTLALRATVVSPEAATNVAAISHSDQFDPNSGNNTASATETPQRADLQVTKSVSSPTPNVGDTIAFTVTLADLGPDAATNVTVTDLLPAGLTFVSSTPSQGTYNSTTGVWTVGTVTPSAAQTLVLTARVVGPAAATNTATVSHSDQFDPNTGNNTGSATATPQQADLALTKTVSNPTPNVGDVITFTLTLSNAGPAAATNVAVTDLLPAGLTFVSATPSQGVYNGGTGLWSVGTLAGAANVTLAIQARVVSPAAATNVATVSHSDQFDPNGGNNSGSTTETPQQADLAVSKSVSNPTPNVGDTITFTVTLTNNGLDNATNVAVNDPLPTGLQFVSATPSQGTYNSATGVWAVGTVATATPQTLLIRATVVSPVAQTNLATISHADQFDPNGGNNTGSTTATPQQADLALTKTVSNSRPNVGDTITFTVTLTNNGPSAATGVQVSDLLPAGLTFVSATPSQGTYAAVSGTWAVGTVARGAQATLNIRAQVAGPITLTNLATIAHSDQFDPVPGDNSAGTTITPQQADLVVSKTVNNSAPEIGDVVTFTVAVTNAGPDTATGVIVTDALPAGLQFVAATPSQGTYNPATGVWTLGSVAGGTSMTLKIQARVVGPAPETNTASGVGDQFDPNPGNNQGSAIVIPLPPGPVPPLPSPPPSKQQLLASTPPPPNPAALMPRFTVSTGAAGLSLVAVAPESGFAPVVRVFDYTSGTERFRIMAYDQNFLGGVNVAIGDVTGDGIPDIITGAGPGGGPHVEVFDGSNGALVYSFMAYDPSFRGGVFVAAGDVNGDGRADIITGAGAGGGPHVEVFSGADLSLLHTFMAYSPSFTGGVRVAAGDVTGDGRADIITGAGAGGGPHVEVFDGPTGQLVRTFMAYDASFVGGVFVAAGDVNGDGRADIITGAGAGGGPHVKVFDGNSLAVMQSFFAFDPTFTGGVTVGACQADGDGRADLVVGTQQGPARVRILNGLTLAELDGFFAFDPRIDSGVAVG